MAIKFEKIQPGMTLWDRHRTKMGNTTMTRMGEWSVYIVEVDRENERAIVRWNGNKETTYYRNQLECLYRKRMSETKPPFTGETDR